MNVMTMSLKATEYWKGLSDDGRAAVLAQAANYIASQDLLRPGIGTDKLVEEFFGAWSEAFDAVTMSDE